MKRHLLLAVLLASTVLAAENPALAQPGTEDAKRADIRRLLELTGAGDLWMQVVRQLLQNFKQVVPKVPAKVWDELAKEINARELIELVVPAYERHFTHADIRSLISFYSSPVGRKFVRVQPALVQESMAAGQAWGVQIGKRLEERLRKAGYLK
jgi:hypothetical protein